MSTLLAESTMYWEKKDGLVLGRFPSLEVMAPGLDLRFASRAGGYSSPPFDSLNIGSGLGDDEGSVLRNREKLLSVLELSPGRVATCSQVHGTAIEEAGTGGPRGECDGLVTSRPGVTLAISTADCIPVAIYSPPEKALVLLHAGREGAAKGIIGRGLEILRLEFDAAPETLVAAMGPGICRECYEVGEEIAASFPDYAVDSSRGSHRLDLRAFCERELLAGGVREDRIVHAGLCTSCEEELCFSHRRDGGRTGRHWTLATIIDM